MELKNNFKQHGIHFTHNDADAVGCALVVSLLNSEWDYENNTYFCSIGYQDKIIGEVLDEIENSEEPNIPQFIIISDISVSEETCDRLEKFCNSFNITLKGFDHHISNNLDTKYSWWTVQKEKVDRPNVGLVDVSATWMVYEYFKQFEHIHYDKLKELVTLISDYDTWTWRKFPQVYDENFDVDFDADIVSVVCNFLKPNLMFKELLNYYKTENNTQSMFPNLFHIIYEVENINKQKYLDNLHHKVKIFTERNIYVAMFISDNNFSNSAAEYLYSNYDFIDVVVVLYPASKSIGLRTRRNDINLGMFAKKYGGGGHPQAAGINLEENYFLNILKTFYINSIPFDDVLRQKEKVKCDYNILNKIAEYISNDN